MSSRIISVIILVIYLCSVSAVFAADRLVPSEYSTIQAAIDDCNDGDVVIIEPNVYTGEGNRGLDFLGKAITVRSEDPEDPCVVAATIIDCYDPNVAHAGFNFHNGEDANSVLAGLTITRGNGGIGCSNGGSPTISHCIIAFNSSVIGGGIRCASGAHPVIKNCTISRNYAAEVGGGICSDGAAAPSIIECDIIDNYAASVGGGVSGGLGQMSNCTIAGNTAYMVGGGVGVYEGPITNCIITNNLTIHHYHGGGAVANCFAPITNCIIAGNTTAGSGGALYNCKDQVTNCTITGNIAGIRGGGLYSCDGPITNCIIYDNNAPTGPQLYGSAEPNYSCIQDFNGGGIGNISADPCFVVPGFWDSNGTPADPNDDFWVNGDYHLKSAGWRWDTTRQQWTWDDVTSRCIDAGNPGSLLEDEPLSVPEDPNNMWGHNLRVNMGAFGRTAEASIPPYDWALLSDMTNDGISDFNDLQVLLSLWLNTGESLYADFNRDGDIDFFDFALLANDWLRQTSWH